MIVDDIKGRLTDAMKARDAVRKDILRLALGEIQTAEARASRSLSEDEGVAVIRKLIKSNEETLSMTGTDPRGERLRQEISILLELLPRALSVDEVVVSLQALTDAIRTAKNEGQATGVAMKHLKSQGLVVLGPDVTLAVRRLREGA